MKLGILKVNPKMFEIPGHQLIRVFLDQRTEPPMISLVFSGPDMPEVPEGMPVPEIHVRDLMAELLTSQDGVEWDEVVVYEDRG